MTISPDFIRTAWFSPIKQFVQVQPDMVTDALNALINDVNAAFLALVVGGSNYVGAFTVAGLPAAPTAGSVAYATNGLKIGEATGFGTGVLAYYSAAGWRVLSTDAPVAS